MTKTLFQTQLRKVWFIRPYSHETASARNALIGKGRMTGLVMSRSILVLEPTIDVILVSRCETFSCVGVRIQLPFGWCRPDIQLVLVLREFTVADRQLDIP